MSLKFIALSGTTGVNENLYVYEYRDEMMIVDCGVGFPDSEMFGVDLVIPDLSYIRQNAHKLKGIIVSQGHEDHQGALPFLLKDVQVPVYAPKLVAAFIKDKLDDYGVGGAEIIIYDPDRDELSIGPFKITPFRVSHSIPDTVGFAIDTPEGRVFHIAEHKFDPDPVDGQPFDIEKAQRLAGKGALFLASDCLGSNKPGSTEGEEAIEGRIEKIVKSAQNTVFFSTISSNISRMQQAINVAGRVNRKVVFIGRSIVKKAEIAHELDYLHYKNKMVVSPKKASGLPRNQVMYIIAGCYGQIGSSLYRVATEGHQRVFAKRGDTMIFSADPAPPYSKESVNFIVDNLIDIGLDVHYYDLGEDLHVSGHGGQDDIIKLFRIINPKYFIPVGGTIRFMHTYKKLVQKYGANSERVFDLKPGEIIEFENGKARRSGKIKVKEVLVDGLGIGDVGEIILKERRTLSKDGVAIALVQLDRAKNKLLCTPDIISRGFVFGEKKRGLFARAAKALRNELAKQERLDRNKIKASSTNFLEKYFYKETGRNPLILPIVVEV